MLILSSTCKVKPEIEFKGYLPIQIDLIPNADSVPLKWTYSDGNDSLLRARINEETGELEQIVLVMVKPENVYFPNKYSIPEQSILVEGCPIVDLTAWSSIRALENLKILQERGRIRLYFSDSLASIVLGEETPISKVVRCERVDFGLNHFNEIRVITVRNINSQEGEVLSSSLGLT